MPSTLVAIDQSIVERLDSIANSLHLSRETALRQAITNFIEDTEYVQDALRKERNIHPHAISDSLLWIL